MGMIEAIIVFIPISSLRSTAAISLAKSRELQPTFNQSRHA